MRLDKYLCECTALSRREAGDCIRRGKVKVDGEVCRDPARKVEERTARVELGEEVLSYQCFHYMVMNKPGGLITASEGRGEATVMRLLPSPVPKHLVPVGRLDKDTEGLLLFTDDGEMNHRLLSPARHVDKVYLVTPQHALSEEDLIRLREGVEIGDEKPTLPALAEMTAQGDLKLTIREGRFHQVKRMLEAVDNQVLHLKRIAFGPLELDPALSPGQVRECTAEEVERLRHACHAAK